MTEENIFLFVPNLIGYARIALALLAFYLMPSYPVPAMFFYLLSALLDAFDGHAARALNQGTKFGAMLDMLTDRCATMCLLVNLALLYPSFTFLFQLSMSLDVASHWLHLHSSIMKGASSHKAIDLSGNPVLRLYYTSRPVLFFMCMGNELFYCLLYILHLLEEPQGEPVAVTPEPLHPSLSLPFPSAILHPFSGISLLHLITASRNMAAIDLAEREVERRKDN
uniref:CDP-diacylglycerol--inositol 3-phosphatidyltransferase n=1 Tax=Paramormyrops kingsleyae TaxID=1676925 RepID=A0A3B3TGD4_9TELE